MKKEVLFIGNCVIGTEKRRICGETDAGDRQKMSRMVACEVESAGYTTLL
jgi:hypothetical protein